MMNAIEKAKEALGKVSRIIDVLELFSPGNAEKGSVAESVREALAALEAEKPAEDAKECAIKVRSECFVDTSPTDRPCFVWDVDTAGHLIHSYAEAYHAKKFDEYLRGLPSFLKVNPEASHD